MSHATAQVLADLHNPADPAPSRGARPRPRGQLVPTGSSDGNCMAEGRSFLSQFGAASSGLVCAGCIISDGR